MLGAVREMAARHTGNAGTKERQWVPLWRGAGEVSWRRRQELYLFKGMHKGWHPENRERPQKPVRKRQKPQWKNDQRMQNIIKLQI